MPLLMPAWSVGVGFVDRPPSATAARIACFASPSTRMLLSSEGLTTTLLTAWVGTAVRVRWAEHQRVHVGDAPTGAGTLLRLDGDAEVVVRHSVLAARDGRDLSRNVVVARLGLAPRAEECLTDTSVPLGERLHAAGTGYRRSVLDAGRSCWGQSSDRPAAYKTYVLWHGDEPLATICEVFNPEVVPTAAARPQPVAAVAR
jgi:chorismate-pyruvate lyase